MIHAKNSPAKPSKTYLLKFTYQGQSFNAIGLSCSKVNNDALLAEYLHANSRLQSIIDAESESDDQPIGAVLAKHGFTDIQVEWMDEAIHY